MKASRWFIVLGAIVLFCGGLAHMIGFTIIIPALAKSGVSVDLLGAVRAVWISFSVQFWVVSMAMVWLERIRGTRGVLFLLWLIPAINAVLMYHYVGLFLGTYMVGAGGLLVLIGLLLSRREADL
jgi:hypothetical protein